MRDKGLLSFMSTFKLQLSSPKVKWLVIFNPEIGLCQNISIYNTSQEINIPTEFKVNRNEIENKGIHIITSSKTDLNAIYKDPSTSEGLFIFPLEKLSTTYIAPSFTPATGESFIGIVATKPNTEVNITLKLPNTDKITFNNTKYGNGETISVHLGERGTLELSSQTDLTGTIIQANKDIGVQSGVDAAKVPVNSGLMNQLLEMVPPVNELGKSFFIPPLFENKEFILRLIAAHPNTTITLLGINSKQATVVVDQIGDHIDIHSNASIKVQSDKPVMAVYYQQGETKPVVPFMVIIKPEGKLGGVQEFTIPDDGLRHHILITAKSTEYPFLQIDGKGVIYRNPHVYDTQSLNSTYVVARADIGTGHHTISSSYPILMKVKPGIIIYADSDKDIAYGYPV
ncbi:uncharacterized protein LOC127732542 [Mytilus californianus]|uniref:uncharacterized protein LOC127732542 n=1 Tax=Mytilus californianus TaxID=6549 RepID=UPI002245DFF8|nr:uncharacterized protein LOC127732542 [Mytilus californianus]